VASKADENAILPVRFRQKDHERGISPEATPMTRGGSLAASDVESTRRNVPVRCRQKREVQPIREGE